MRDILVTLESPTRLSSTGTDHGELMHIQQCLTELDIMAVKKKWSKGKVKDKALVIPRTRD